MWKQAIYNAICRRTNVANSIHPLNSKKSQELRRRIAPSVLIKVPKYREQYGKHPCKNCTNYGKI